VVLISVVRGIKHKDETYTGYILAGPDVMWLATVAPVFAADIGTSPWSGLCRVFAQDDYIVIIMGIYIYF